MNAPSPALLKAVAVTAELCGRTFSDAAAEVFVMDLAGYPEDQVIRALTRCRKEVKGLLTLHDVITRLDDGRPGPEQAWAMLPHDEQTSTVWSDEMAQAWGVALPLLDEGDKVAARMAFKETYTKLVSEARDQKRGPKWTVSFGRDRNGRQAALAEAVRHNRLSLDHAVQLLPMEAAEGLLIALGARNHPLLAAPSTEGKQKVGQLLSLLKGKSL